MPVHARCDAARLRRGRLLKPFLDDLTTRYHRADLLGTDPLATVREFDDRTNREVGGLFAALLAYGNVKQIRASLARLFAAMGGAPGAFVRGYDHARDFPRLRGFRHRFTGEEDIACLCHLLRQALRGDSLEPAFLRGYDPAEPDITGAAARFVDHLMSLDFGPHFDRRRMLASTSFKHLVPRADKGSACKRIHLFLRWMVRPDDGIDLGLWRAVDPEKLLVPVDTHILRVGRNLGAIRARTHSLVAAREITAVLRGADPADPARYDFALCRLGILKQCPTTAHLGACRECALHDACEKRRSLERRSARRAAPRG
jgi:uncharacterized protein (TIGR02757 family)